MNLIPVHRNSGLGLAGNEVDWYLSKGRDRSSALERVLRPERGLERSRQGGLYLLALYVALW